MLFIYEVLWSVLPIVPSFSHYLQHCGLRAEQMADSGRLSVRISLGIKLRMAQA
jgi:hypothetical protein